MADENPPEEYTPTSPKGEEVKTGRKAAPTKVQKPDVRKSAVVEDEVPQSYVWLADGSVVLCENEDLPQGHNGTVAPFGHWEKNGKVFVIVGVYPVEITLPKD